MTKNKPKAVCLYLLLFFAGTLQVDMGALLGYTSCDGRMTKPSSEKKATPQLEEGQKNFMQKQYATAVTEIQARLEQESVLFAFKFSLVGAILAFLFSFFLKESSPTDSQAMFNSMFATSIAAGICWAAVVTSAVIDSRIEFHSNMIIALGTWIRDYVEPFLLPDRHAVAGAPIGWETYLSQESALSKSKLYAFLRLNANLLTFLIFAATTLFFYYYIEKSPQPTAKKDITRRICLAGSLFSITVFLLVSIQLSFRNHNTLLISVVTFIAAIACALFVWHQAPNGTKEESRDVQSNPE